GDHVTVLKQVVGNQPVADVAAIHDAQVERGKPGPAPGVEQVRALLLPPEERIHVERERRRRRPARAHELGQARETTHVVLRLSLPVMLLVAHLLAISSETPGCLLLLVCPLRGPTPLSRNPYQPLVPPVGRPEQELAPQPAGNRAQDAEPLLFGDRRHRQVVLWKRATRARARAAPSAGRAPRVAALRTSANAMSMK